MAVLKLGSPDGVVLRLDDSVSFVNTAAENTLISYVVNSNVMSMANELQFNLYLTLTTRALLPGNLTIRVKYGSAILTLGGGSVALLGGATETPFKISGTLSNKGTLNAQFIESELRQGSGGLTLGQPINMAFIETNQNSTVDNTFAVTAQFSAADAANKITLKRAKATLN